MGSSFDVLCTNINLDLRVRDPSKADRMSQTEQEKYGIELVTLQVSRHPDTQGTQLLKHGEHNAVNKCVSVRMPLVNVTENTCRDENRAEHTSR